MTETTKSHADPLIEGPNPETIRRAKRWLVLVLAVLLVVGVWTAWSFLKEGRETDRWEELARIERLYGTGDTRQWTEPITTHADAVARDEHVKKLETFLAKHEADPAIAAELHGRIANLEMELAAGLLAGSPATDVTAHLANARKHLEALIKGYPDVAINQERFAPILMTSVPDDRGGRILKPEAGKTAAASVARLALSRLASFELWQKEHGVRPAEPDADPVVVLRTTEGDLRLRFFAAASPNLVRSFLERVCAGALDDTLVFEKREDATTAWARAGDPRTKGALTADDAARVLWGTPSAGIPLVAEDGRNRVLHTKGTVSAWHPESESSDDPFQFLLVLKPSARMDFAFTPFAKVDGDASLSTLERLVARRSRVQEKADLRNDPKLAALVDQLVTPVVIKRALVYEKGALKACHDASKVDESEKRLDTLKLDAYREAPPAPAPATAPAMDGAAMDGPAMSEAPKDGAAMEEPAMNDAPMDGAKTDK